MRDMHPSGDCFDVLCANCHGYMLPASFEGSAQRRATVFRSGKTYYYYYGHGSKAPQRNSSRLRLCTCGEALGRVGNRRQAASRRRHHREIYRRALREGGATGEGAEHATAVQDCLKYLYEFFDDPPAPIAQIQPLHVRQYLDWRRDAPVRANRKRALLYCCRITRGNGGTPIILIRRRVCVASQKLGVITTSTTRFTRPFGIPHVNRYGMPWIWHILRLSVRPMCFGWLAGYPRRYPLRSTGEDRCELRIAIEVNLLT